MLPGSMVLFVGLSYKGRSITEHNFPVIVLCSSLYVIFAVLVIVHNYTSVIIQNLGNHIFGKSV